MRQPLKTTVLKDVLKGPSAPLPRSDGQPRSDGLQANSDGLQPRSDSLQPNSDGLQPHSGGLQPNSDGLQPNSGGLQPNSDGLLQAMSSNLIAIGFQRIV